MDSESKGDSVQRTKLKPFCGWRDGAGCVHGEQGRPLICFAKGIRDKFNEIINRVRYRINPARIESANAVIKRIQAKACGQVRRGASVPETAPNLFPRLQNQYKTTRASAGRFETDLNNMFFCFTLAKK